MLSRTRFLRSAAAALLLIPVALSARPGRRAGVLLLAHGSHAMPGPTDKGAATHSGHAGSAPGHAAGGSVWNRNVEAVASALETHFPTEVAFGMADSQSIQAAVQRLETRGVHEIAVVPLFVSSHSPIIGNSRYILGLQPELARSTRLRHLDRVKSSASFRFASAIAYSGDRDRRFRAQRDR